jgi:hypothetical protein
MVLTAMTDENDKNPPETAPEEPSAPEEPDPVEDLKHGINLLFRAAKKAAQGAGRRARDATHTEKVENAFKSGVDDLQKAFDRLQSDKLEGALKSSLQEIGRAFGNVAQTLERELRGEDAKHDDEHGEHDEHEDDSKKS